MKKSAAPALILIFLILAVGIFVVFRIKTCYNIMGNIGKVFYKR